MSAPLTAAAVLYTITSVCSAFQKYYSIKCNLCALSDYLFLIYRPIKACLFVFVYNTLPSGKYAFMFSAYILHENICCIISPCVCACTRLRTKASWLSILRASLRGQTERQCQEHNYTNLLAICRCACMRVSTSQCASTCANMHPIVCAYMCLLVKSPASSGHDTQRQLPACWPRAKHIASEMTDACHTAQLWDSLHCGLDIWAHGSLQMN